MNKIYSFISYGDGNGEEKWGEGTVQITGVFQDGFTQVEVLTNSNENSFVGQNFFVDSNAQTDGTIYQLYSDAGVTPAGIYVSISSVV